MIIKEITLNEANVAKKINDPRLLKMVNLAIQHDNTLPRHIVASLGRHPSEEATIQLLSDIIDNSLANSSYGDISRDGKYDQWLVRQYANGAMDYEDLTGEGADALGAFKALGRRGVLKPFHQDINKFRSLRQLITVIMGRGSPYQAALQSMRDEATLNKMKRDKREVVLIDDENFFVTIPLNYGACYYFNNALGVRASFCTGSSSTSWFGRYAGEGPMIDILNKKDMGETTGKWQIHAPTNQIKDASQSYQSRDEVFATLYPGLLKKICYMMLSKAEEINELSKGIVNDSGRYIVPDGYNVKDQVELLKRKFPESYNSKPEEEPEELNPEELGMPDAPEQEQNGLQPNPYVTWQVSDEGGNTMSVRATNPEEAVAIARRNGPQLRAPYRRSEWANPDTQLQARRAIPG